jgi:hypothetical protein
LIGSAMVQVAGIGPKTKAKRLKESMRRAMDSG